jgi:hypothetical protein
VAFVARYYRLALGLAGVLILVVRQVILSGSTGLTFIGPSVGSYQFKGFNLDPWLTAGLWLLAALLLVLAVFRRRSVARWAASGALLVGLLGYFFLFSSDWFLISPAFMPKQIEVVDVEGPPVTITINGEPVADLVCQNADGANTVTLAADKNLPALPWHLTVLRADGVLINTFDFDHLDPWLLLVRGEDSAYLMPRNAPSWGGPAPPSPECPGGGLQH